MEMVEGPTLAERIAAGPIPLDDAEPLIDQLVDGFSPGGDSRKLWTGVSVWHHDPRWGIHEPIKTSEKLVLRERLFQPKCLRVVGSHIRYCVPRHKQRSHRRMLCFDEYLNVKACATIQNNIRNENIQVRHHGRKPDRFGDTAG
jgi:hypothetical protein